MQATGTRIKAEIGPIDFEEENNGNPSSRGDLSSRRDMCLAIGFTVLIWMTITAHLSSSLPGKVSISSGEQVFTREDILAGQQVFLRYGLMENGTIWGHGAYLGPDFSTEYLHTLALDAGEKLTKQNFNRSLKELSPVVNSPISSFDLFKNRRK